LTSLGIRVSALISAISAKTRATVLLAGCCMACAPLFAGPVLVTTPGALGSNDSTSWAQLGGDQTVLTGPFTATSAQSVGVTGNFDISPTDNTGLVAVVCPASPSCSWGPTSVGMIAGDTDLFAFDNGTNLGTGPIDLSLATALLGAGAWLEGDTLGAYTASIQAFNGSNSLGAALTETSDSAGDPIFIGILDSTADVTKVEFSLTDCAGCSNNGDFAIDTLLMTDAVSATPEPSTILLLGSGLAGLAWTRRRRSSNIGR
jgi:hypothetical protein